MEELKLDPGRDVRRAMSAGRNAFESGVEGRWALLKAIRHSLGMM